ncbi:polysaccharide biosynthesis protein [Thalassiella azotivora]
MAWPPRGLTRSSWKWLPFDLAVWWGALCLAVWTRYDFSVAAVDWSGVVVFAVVVAALQSASGAVVGIYLGRFVPGSFEEAAALAWTGAAVTAAAFGWTLVVGPLYVPRSVPLATGAAAVVGCLALRFVGRAWSSRSAVSSPDALPVVVYGAGSAGTQLIRHMQTDSPRRFVPRALLDDDPAKRRLEVSGVAVRGGLGDLARVAERVRAEAVVVALPNAASDLMRDVTRRAEAAGLRVLVLPPLHQMMHRQVGSGDLRDVDVFDLLGRRPVQLEESAIASSITRRRVLVTGAGGSIGSELCRQIDRFGPAELVMLDRDESALHAVQLSLRGSAMLDGQDTVLADIRDPRAVHRVFQERRPEVVFHAAALKHLPLLEQYPLEAWMTNVLGTQTVLEAARDAGVSVFVNISTDKAANPTSVLGWSKRVAERLTAGMAHEAPGCYVSVRFGNVLGSRGSVLTAFEKQIAAGGPVTVTDPEVTRFFMTIAEACQLVLQAAAIGADGEAMVLDMGEPVSIVEVARTLIDRSGRTDVGIVYTGLRAGEKLHEELFGDEEPQSQRPKHPLVSHVPVPALRLGRDDLDPQRFADGGQARAWLVAASRPQQQPAGQPLSRAQARRRASGVGSG